MIFRFADPAALLMLLVLPVIVAGWFLGRRTRLSIGFPLMEKLRNIPGAVSPLPVWIPRVLRMTGLALVIIAAARPQSGEQKEVVYSEGVDIVIALDISGSMRALDFQPDNRFEVGRRVISDFIKGRPNDRVGLVMFAS
ncbi:MAG TPA: VWA domain-containing protein, partial [bacterium]|nr:VWA domain-containing protein [bacterium]